MPRLSAVFALLAALAVAACAPAAAPKTFPELTYRHLQPIDLMVASVEVKSDFTASMTPPRMEHRFPTPPAEALLRWARDRLQASGGEATARFTVTDGAAVETALATQKGIKGAFTKEQSERYDAVLEARLEIFDFGGNSLGHATARAHRSITVREDATVNDREQVWFDLTEALMKDINGELEKNISAYLGNWLR